ncbi:MAG: hypothetical protein ACOX4D_01040 [Bacteroidales bacterium]
MKKDILKLTYKFLILFILIIGLGILYKYTFYEKDLQKESPIINLSRRAVDERANIIYTGESSNLTIRDDDIDKRYISDFIGDHFPNLTLVDLTKEASHAGIYYELIRNIPDTLSSLSTVIVTLNLRSFNAEWIYSTLETSLQKSLVLIKDNPPFFNRFLLSFKGYYIKNEKESWDLIHKKWKKDTYNLDIPIPYNNVIEWDKDVATKGVIINGERNEEATQLATSYVKTYGFQIDTNNNPRIKDFDKIVKLAKERNLNLVFNLLAENVEKAQKLVGDDLVSLMKYNRDLLVDRYTKMGVIVVDNLEKIEDEQFIDQNWTTEHYAEKGRKIIAKNVAKAIQHIYPDDFVDTVYIYKKKYNYFNDCEGKIWNQSHTLTDEKAYSGKKSSKINNENPYSVTFTYPTENLPDSLQKVNVSFMAYQTKINEHTAIIMELKNDETNNSHLEKINLSELSNITDKWVNISHTFEFNGNLYDYKLIKLYVYNPTNDNFYIDDFMIDFK